MEEETSLLKYTATNGKNELPMFFIKDMDQSKINAHNINQKTIYTASDFLLVGFPSPKTLTLRSTPHHSVILRGTEGEVAESIIQKITLASGRGGTVADGG